MTRRGDWHVNSPPLTSRVLLVRRSYASLSNIDVLCRKWLVSCTSNLYRRRRGSQTLQLKQWWCAAWHRSSSSFFDIILNLFARSWLQTTCSSHLTPQSLWCPLVFWPSELICKVHNHVAELFIGTNFSALKWKSANLCTSLSSDRKECLFALERAFWFQGCKQRVRVCVCAAHGEKRETRVPRLGKGKAAEHENAKCAHRETPSTLLF